MSADAPPVLMLLNGLPGSGKSTLASALAEASPQVVTVDVDTIKHALPQWPADPQAAGLAAREAALDQAGRSLAEGQDVVLGQLAARPELPRALADLASRRGARFMHVLLVLPADALRERLEGRRARPTRPEQAVNDAGLGVEDALDWAARIETLPADAAPDMRLDATAPLEEMVSALVEVLRGESLDPS